MRRAGEVDRARREVARAARSGLAEARETLDAEFPLDADAQALLEVLAAPPDATRRAAWAAQILWGDGDPRLADAAEAWLERAIQDGREEGGRLHLLISDYVERLGEFLGTGGPALERSILSGEEGISLLERVDTRLDPLKLLQLRFLAIKSGDADFLEQVMTRFASYSSGTWIERVGFDQGRAGGFYSSGVWTERVGSDLTRPGGLEGLGAPWRPSWVRPTLRDPGTFALSHHALRGRNLAPGSLELPECEGVFLFAVDETEGSGGLTPAPVGSLVSAVDEVRDRLGDRIVRYISGNRFLVPLESASLVVLCEECARASSTSLSGSVASKARLDRSEAWPLVLEEGLARARERGPGSLEVIEG